MNETEGEVSTCDRPNPRWIPDAIKAVFCSLELANSDDAEIVNAIGVRAAESRARAKMPVWEPDPEVGEVLVWRPLIAWTMDDIIEIHQRHGLRPNPLYFEGHSRVGCWPCIYARKEEIERLPQNRVDEIAELERELTEAARLRGAAEPMRSFFGFHDPLTGATKCAPIEQVRVWSRTEHGGVQLRLLQPPAGDGCMRWGMCDTQGGADA